VPPTALVFRHHCLLEIGVRVVVVPVPIEELQVAGLVAKMLDQLALVVAVQVQFEVALVRLETVVLVEALPYLVAAVLVVAELEPVVEVQDLPYFALLEDHALEPSTYRGHTLLS